MLQKYMVLHAKRCQKSCHLHLDREDMDHALQRWWIDGSIHGPMAPDVFWKPHHASTGHRFGSRFVSIEGIGRFEVFQKPHASSETSCDTRHSTCSAKPSSCVLRLGT